MTRNPEGMPSLPRFEVRLAVLPVPGLRSPAAEAVSLALRDLGFDGPQNLSIGKLFLWETAAPSLDAAREEAEHMADRLLRNPVTEEARVLSVRALPAAGRTEPEA